VVAAVAEEAAVTTAVVAVVAALPAWLASTAVPAAVEAAPHHTLSKVVLTFTCGKGGRTRPAMV